MKKIALALFQFVLFLLVFLAGSLASPLQLKWAIAHPTATSTHYFVPDGLLLTLALYIVILIVEALRKRIGSSGLWTTAAFCLALVLGLLSKFGSVTKDLY